jgi:hypothetical protein
VQTRHLLRVLPRLSKHPLPAGPAAETDVTPSDQAS